MTRPPCPLAGLLPLELHAHTDERGSFCEVWSAAGSSALEGWRPFVQENHSTSRGGVLRGLHLQVRRPQGKLVRVVRGEIFDVAVDLRPGSTTWGRWQGHVLSESNQTALWIPPGMAHGYYVSADIAEVVYLVTDTWDPSSEVSIRWNDPAIGIQWPLHTARPPVLSARDGSAALLAAVDLSGLEV